MSPQCLWRRNMRAGRPLVSSLHVCCWCVFEHCPRLVNRHASVEGFSLHMQAFDSHVFADTNKHSLDVTAAKECGQFHNVFFFFSLIFPRQCMTVVKWCNVRTRRTAHFFLEITPLVWSGIVRVICSLWVRGQLLWSHSRKPVHRGGVLHECLIILVSRCLWVPTWSHMFIDSLFSGPVTSTWCLHSTCCLSLF